MNNSIVKQLVHQPLKICLEEITLIKISSLPVINPSCLYSSSDTVSEQEYLCMLVQMNSPASEQYTIENVKYDRCEETVGFRKELHCY